VAFIPTQSLFQIEEKCHDKLDSKFYVITAENRWKQQTKIEPLSDYLQLKTSASYKAIRISFNRDKCDMLFSLPKAVEECHALGAYDMFVDKLAFFFPIMRGVVLSPTYVYFNNVSPTSGSTIEELVKASRKLYLKKHGYDASELRMPRMLEFTIARTVEGHPIDQYEVSSDKFLKSLSNETSGLVMSLSERAHRRTVFKHLEYEAYDTCWKEEVSEIE